MSGQAQNHGTKVTDPKTTSQESAGPIASDSLAAESQSFQDRNRNAQPLGVSGSNSTFATRDHSNATTIPAARDAPSRLDPSETYPDALGGQSKSTAVEDTSNNSASISSASAGTAPNYANPALHAGDGKPKGKNLKELGDADGGNNASFGTDIGGRGDPGRLAEKGFAAGNPDGLIAAGLPNQGVKEGTSFDALESEEAT